MKIAVTGAGGFLGSAAVECFLDNAAFSEIRALYRHAPVNRQKSARLVQIVGDLTDSETAEVLLDGVSVVLHLASHGYPLDKVDDPAAIVVENVRAAGVLIAAMQKQDVGKIIFSSSGGALYPPSTTHIPVKEDAQTATRSAYAIFKLATEGLLQLPQHADWLQPCILRISNPYGTGLLRHQRQGFIGVAMKSLLSGRTMEIWGSDQIRKDFIYVDDVLSAFEKAIFANDFPVGTFHISSGVDTSLREVIEMLEEVSGRKLITKVVAGSPSDSYWTALDSSKFHQATGWAPRYNLKEGLRATWTSLK